MCFFDLLKYIEIPVHRISAEVLLLVKVLHQSHCLYSTVSSLILQSRTQKLYIHTHQFVNQLEPQKKLKNIGFLYTHTHYCLHRFSNTETNWVCLGGVYSSLKEQRNKCTD